MRIKLEGRIPSLHGIIGNIATKRSRAFNQIAKQGKEDIKKELRSPKRGIAKSRRALRYKASPARRSARGESLARDTGASENLISSSKEGSILKIGFLENPYGMNYVAYHEEENRRPTIKKSRQKTLPKIISIMNENFKL
jgi:hypothetical protein